MHSLPTEDFAPANKPFKGKYNVCFIDIQWQDKQGIGHKTVKQAAQSLSEVYAKLSRGKLDLKVTVASVSVPFNHGRQNFYKAVKYAKNRVNVVKVVEHYDFYGISHNKTINYSYASGDTAYLDNVREKTVLLVCGYLFGLGRADLAIAGTQKIEFYQDPTDLMGMLWTLRLNAPHMYHMGWYKREQVAQHNPDSESKVYALEKVGSENNELFKSVRIPLEGREMFLSLDIIPKDERRVNAFLLHYRDKGHTILTKTFSSKLEYEGLVFERQQYEGNTARIKISPALSA